MKTVDHWLMIQSIGLYPRMNQSHYHAMEINHGFSVCYPPHNLSEVLAVQQSVVHVLDGPAGA